MTRHQSLDGTQVRNHLLPSRLVSRPRFRCFRVVAVALAVLVLSPFPARAGQPTTADVERLIKRGNELRTARKDQEALPIFQKAYEITPTPRTAAQLGLCEMALGYWLAADAHLTEALAGRNDWINRNRATIEASLRRAQQQIGELNVSGAPVGATVTINGKSVGTLPLAPVRVAAGHIKVELTAPGHKDRTETVVVVGEAKERVTLYLAREGAPIAEPRFSGKEQAPKPAGGLGQTPPSRGESPVWGPGKIAGAALVGAGVLGIASGTTLLFMDKRQNCELHMVDAQCNERTQTRVPGWALIGIGVAAGTAGGIIFYSSGSTQAAVSVGPSSLVVSGQFQ